MNRIQCFNLRSARLVTEILFLVLGRLIIPVVGFSASIWGQLGTDSQKSWMLYCEDFQYNNSSLHHTKFNINWYKKWYLGMQMNQFIWVSHKSLENRSSRYSRTVNQVIKTWKSQSNLSLWPENWTRPFDQKVEPNPLTQRLNLWGQT